MGHSTRGHGWPIRSVKIMRSRPFCLASILLAAVVMGCGESSSTVTPQPTPTPTPTPTPVASIAVITVSPVSATMAFGSTRVLSAEAKNAAGATVAVTFAWHSSQASVATVDANGTVTALAAGTTNLSASSGNVTSNSVSITVTVVVGAPGSVVVDKVSTLLTGIGQSAQLSANRLDAQGAPVVGTVIWSSSAPDRVSIDATGKLLAKAIGSAQIFAEVGGVRSIPTIVLVAQPQPGALVLTDAQVVSVGPFLRLAPGEGPGVGTQFEVTLQGVSAPPPGIVVVAAETAPVAGKVVTTRQGSAGLVVTLAIAPLYQLFSAYDIALSLDLAAFSLAPVQPASSARIAQPSVSASWNEGRNGKASALAPSVAFAAERFSTFSCFGSIKPQIISSPIELTLDNQLKLVLDDRPGYSKHALEGSIALVGDAGITLKAGFTASGGCDAKRLFNLPVFGWFSLIVMPAVRLGFGAALSSEILLVQGELGVQGKVGFSGVTGWECGGVTPACRGLDDITPLNEFKTKSKIPSGDNDGMQAKISAQFYVLAGLDASFGVGLFSGGILEARYGPKQSFDLALEVDQASRKEYASTYDLKLDGVVEPGAALKKAIELVIADDAVGVTFKAKFSKDVSESPKGTLSVNKARVGPNQPVDFTVQLVPNTVSYKILGYNVTGVELYRKREDESKFTQWKSIPIAASNQDRFTYRWTPVEADAGKYEFAAFVNTQLLTPLLEIAPNSIVPVEVTCFSSVVAARIVSQGVPTCADVWTGTSTYIVSTPGVPAANFTYRSNITWIVDPTISRAGNTYYTASGTFDVEINQPDPSCTITLSPKTFAIASADPMLPPSRLGIINNGVTPAIYAFSGSQFITTTTTTHCAGKADVVSQLTRLLVDFASGSGPFTAGQSNLSGTSNDGVIKSTWNFNRP